jgi:HlyD family secretion protein
LQRRLSESAAGEARETEADAARIASRLGIVVPANEVLFFGSLPLRVDSVRVRRGDSVTTNVMTVSNSNLAIDSSLSLNDAELVRRGAQVTIEEPDLGVRTTGVVTQVADRPGTHKVDPSRVYLEVAPGTAPVQLVGASVKLTIAVRSTRDAVLTVPVNALSVGADGRSRVERQDSGGQSEYVDVEPGLAAHGLVEVRPVSGPLAADDLVVVGARGARTVRGGGGP